MTIEVARIAVTTVNLSKAGVPSATQNFRRKKMASKLRIELFDRISIFGRRWYFRVVRLGTNERIAASEAYNSPRARNEAVALLQQDLRSATLAHRR